MRKPGRGWSRALQKVVMGDGAEWIWNLVGQHFSDALQIVDLYHARQHLWEVARKLYPNEEEKQKAWMKIHQKRLLDRGKIEKLVGALRSIESDNPEVAEKIRTEADYFERNRERMRYPKFRRQHLFVGSGVIEAGCKTVVAARLKRSGMFWTVRGANAILALRCCHLNGDYGCPQNTYRGQTVCSNDVRIFRRALEEKLLDGLQEQVMRPEVIDYVLAKFEAELTNAVDSLSGELEQMRRRRGELEREIGNLANFVAQGDCSPGLQG